MKKPVITLLHIGYWLLYLLLLLLILVCLKAGSGLTNRAQFFNLRFDIFIAAFAVIPALIGFYLFYALIFARFLASKKAMLFFCSAIAASIIGGLAGAGILTLLFYCKVGPGIFADGFTSAVPLIIIMAFIALLNGIVGLVMKGFISWYADIKIKEELNKRNHETELALVKSQLDPHFLFNTINNIDVLIEIDAAKASLYLNKLSAIMRFMLYETKAEKITLQKELEYIEKYIELQKIRSANPNYIHYTANIGSHTTMITPMLFTPFIENAFKHSENRKADNTIRIVFSATHDTIIFECENSCSKSKQVQENTKVWEMN